VVRLIKSAFLLVQKILGHFLVVALVVVAIAGAESYLKGKANRQRHDHDANYHHESWPADPSRRPASFPPAFAGRSAPLVEQKKRPREDEHRDPEIPESLAEASYYGNGGAFSATFDDSLPAIGPPLRPEPGKDVSVDAVESPSSATTSGVSYGAAASASTDSADTSTESSTSSTSVDDGSTLVWGTGAWGSGTWGP
jgi:hypothetical protein